MRYLAACLLLFPFAASAAPMTLSITPGNMLAQTRSHALFMTITGTFRQLSGTLVYDPEAKTCHIDVTFMVRSLELPNALLRSQTMSAGFLDPAQYPEQHYVADCHGGMLAGQLTMRGQTHPFDMTISEDLGGSSLLLEGTLNRYDWGINGLSLTVGKMIQVTNEISLGGRPMIVN